MGTGDPGADFRAKATRGVAIAALTLLLPFVLVSLAQGAHLNAVGTGAIVLMLALNTWLVARGRDHERVTLYGLVPGGMLFMIQVFQSDGIVGSVWCYPAILGCYCMLGRRRALIANGIILAIALPMIWRTLDPGLAARFSATLLAVSAFGGILVREIDAMRSRLRTQIERDPLTGLLNRTSLAPRLESAVSAFRTELAPAALIGLDLDHFKSINDELGHEAGDAVLREVARCLNEGTRPDDAVFRLGGEEFLIVLRGVDPSTAAASAERLRAAVAETPLRPGRTVTASFGVATLRPEDDAASWMRRADRRLYAAKRAGRDRVVCADAGDAAGGDGNGDEAASADAADARADESIGALRA